MQVKFNNQVLQYANRQQVLSNSMKEHQNQGTENDIIADDQNYIFKAWRDLKDSIFNVLYVLLDSKQEEQQEEPMLGLIFQSGFDYLQMLAFPFNSFIISSWNGGQTLTNVFTLFNKFNVVSYMPGVGFNTFLILLYALIFLIILVLIDIIYVSYSFSKKKFKFTWPLIILAKLVPLFVTIFFLPITQTLLSVVSCQQDSTNSYQVMTSFPDVVCWKGWHLFHAAITLLFVALFVFISSVVALALFEPRMTSNKITARQNSTGQVIFIFNKIICQLIFSFTPFDQLWVYSVMLFALSGWLYWTYNMNDPFYDKRASKFFRILSSYYFWTNFMLLVSQLLGPLGFDGGLVIWISGLPFIGIIIGFQHKSNIDQLFSFNLKFKSGQQLQNHLRYVLQLLQSQQQDKNSYMLITGYIEKHKQICVEDDCPLKITKKLNKTLSDKQDLNQKFLLQIQRMYKSGIKKYPSCTKLRLSFAFFQLERLKNKNKAYEQFSYALKTNPTFEQQFIVYRFKKIIKQNLQEGEETEQNKTDLIEIIRFQNHISLCEQAMIRSARLHKDFWTQLKQETPDLKKLNQLGSKITLTINVVKQNYQQIQKINNSVLQVLYCYSLYLLMVTKDNLQGKKLLDMSKKLYLQKMSVSYKKQDNQECSVSEIQTSNLPIVCVSSKLSSVGKVLNVNSLFSQLSGYQRQQIVQRNLQKILSDIYKDVHEQKIKCWLQSQQETSYLNRPNIGYLKLKSGFIMPVQYQVYYKSASESFIVSFQNNSTIRNCCHLILDQNKVIKECSILGHAYFGLDRRVINDNDIFIQDFLGIKNLSQLAKRYNSQKTFQHNIYYQDQQIPCQMNVTQISMKIRQVNSQKHNSDDQQDEMIVQVKKVIGYYLKIRVISSEKIQLLKQLKKNEQSQSKQSMQSISQGVMDLYEQPNLFDILITTLAETKTKNNAQNRFELKYKIKTMRLLNNEIKMVYDQNANIDFDKNDHGDLEDDDLQMLKLNDDRYHQKIRQAINTKLNHQQINKLTYLGVIFIAIILVITIAQMLVCLQIFSMFTTNAQTILNVTEETNSLAKYITASLDTNVNYTAIATQITAHNVTVDAPQLNVTINLSNNSTQQVNIRDGYLYFYSRLTQFFLLKGNFNIQNIYSSFIQFVYPTVQLLAPYANSSLPNLQRIFMMVLFFIAFAVSLTYLIFWIYMRLKIDKKKSTILLWFLDIPISYVAFLGENCDNYLKNFISIKEVMEKGIKIQEQLQLQDYKQVKGKEEQIQQQQKARKTLLMKQRKLTFLSRLKFKHLKMGWIIIFGLVYSLVAMSQTLALKNYESFLINQRLFSSRTVIWANAIHISMYLNSSGRTTLNGTDVTVFERQNLKKFENTLTLPQLSNFISDILSQDNNVNYKQIVSSYLGIYAVDLCSYLNQTSSNCNTIVGSSLKGGYRVFSMYLRDSEHTNKEQLREANEKYGAKGLIYMLNTWKNIMNSQVDKANSLVSILFYVYIFAGLLFFFIAWMLYLSSLNTQINQAIRMLNMIPFKLLSSSRKQTRSFISWIIKEANKKNHQF